MLYSHFTVYIALLAFGIFLLAVDHLVNNAGIGHACILEEVEDVTNLRPVMVIPLCLVIVMIISIVLCIHKVCIMHVRACPKSWLGCKPSNIYNISSVSSSHTSLCFVFEGYQLLGLGVRHPIRRPPS